MNAYTWDARRRRAVDSGSEPGAACRAVDGREMGHYSVALKKCASYDRATVERAVDDLFSLLGGPGAFVSAGQSVFLKVNALIGAAPEKGITTHPEVVRAVARRFREVTDDVTVGDSPGGPFSVPYLKRVYEKCGFAEVARQTGASLGLDTSVAQVPLPDGRALKTLTICGAMEGADCLVSISKFKTHMFLNISGAIKNLFGAVPGGSKITYHSRFPADTAFADLIVDAMVASAPDLNIVDAVVGMDGNGPRAGNLIDMNLIAAGRDAVSVDTAMMEVIGVDLDRNKPLAAALARGLGTKKPELLGDDLRSVSCRGFRLPDKKDVSERAPDFLMRAFGNRLALMPEPRAGKCVGCGKCAEACPVRAISVSEGLAVVDRRTCARCYCCHELCEYDAIELAKPLLMRALMFNRGG